MGNILLELLRDRIMVDKGLIERTYLPWFISLMNGTLQPDSVLRMKKEYSQMPYAFDRSAFATDGYNSAVAMDSAPDGSIAIVPIIGEFLKYGGQCSYGADEIAPVIAMAGDNTNIAGLVLEVDSGGGMESAVPPFIKAIQYVQSKGKPVVVHGDMVASAAYYISSFADYILFDNKISSAFGSVGVLVSFMDYRKKFKKEGIKHRMIYAPQSDLKNEELRAIMENDDETPLIENSLRPSAERFIDTIKQNRKGKIKEKSDVYRGKMYEGDLILKEGLADGMGSLMDAVEIAASLAIFKKKR
jgi:protease-4